ncbi:hypothetical protein RO3G_10607 [Rhizopus delemar RA 99-880]|uniref:Ricin B lectin domain-containing protein n=1 Tax=Rhizopus delemar (strain RA 99-880 / ATCC MYA-4621 / FGSC 9543 / NRRL 43880) TaxID=246409 RepID=I1CBR7_RHIO9|nr:hypothetical protein RO3G_10607 [Rhizopus delemar RA 99-880]|eukprot:EIE85897.1 hypothetical protein RO3G_10607 [Rhizopus delemar RA 99-880]
MFEKSENFPENWFFIKNHSNGYVLMVENESQETGSPIVLSTIRTKDYASQLWRYDPKGFLINKKSGQVMDVAKGNAKAGVDIVQQIQSTNLKEEDNYQKFGLSPHGHIYLMNKSSLVLGIKESFFARREGLHVHLQLVDKRNLDRKEQRWDFVLPIVKEKPDPAKRSSSSSTVSTSTPTKLPATVAQLKEDDARSVHSTGSGRSSIDQDESVRIPIGSFPDSPFFLKSDASGLYISTESITSTKPGSILSIDSLRKKGYDSQLWTFDPSNHRIVNKMTKLVLGVEHNSIKDGAYVCQVASSTAQDKTQAWTLSPEGEVTLKNDPSFVIGFKESWFGNREGAHLHLQKKLKGNQQQKFTVVMPIFKKSETVKVEKRGVFPEGWFFVKSQAHGLVLTVLETGTIAAEVEAAKLDTSNYSRQLWKSENGYLVNKASEMVLDIRGGAIASGATICQYTKKTENNENQQWGLTVEGSIHPESNKNLILTVKENETVRSALFLSEKKAHDHKGQCWNFVVPVFKKKQVTSTVKKTSSFKLASYPSGWFFIRSYLEGSTTESPYVLTATEKSIGLSLLDRENWQTQLWSYSDGKLISYSTDLVIHVDSFAAGSELVQSSTSDKEWFMTMDGYLLYGSDKEKLALSVAGEKGQYKLIITHHKYSQEFRWGFLVPKFGYRQGRQILIQWSLVVLREYRKLIKTTVTTTAVDHPIAEWPQGEFFIRGSEGYALVPEKSEAGSLVVMKQLETENAELFKWTYRNGYLVHVLSKYVLRIQDKLVDGAKLQLTTEAAGDEYQYWLLKTNGQIVSKKDQKFGLNLVQINGVWTVQISSTQYHAWRLLYGIYERRYSEKEQKDILYLTRFQRIILTLLVNYKHNVDRKLVTRSFGVFPEGWMFIRSKHHPELVITISEKKKGAKLILSKLDFKSFARQLWRFRDDHCLVNMETDYVMDVAGGKLLPHAQIIQWSPKFLRSSQKNQIWGLSVDGEIHTETNTSLVLGLKEPKEGAALKLMKRDEKGESARWTFARPVFGKTKYSTVTEQQAHRGELVLESTNEPAMDVSKTEKYERVNKRVVTRRYGIFPTGGFFIRCTCGERPLALTVERGERLTVVLRALNFKQYKSQLWTYSDGYLVNEETGLVLDAQASEDLSLEGPQPQLYLHPKASNEGQFWDLGAEGEIHLRSNERLTIGVAKPEEASVEGALVGLQKIRVVRSESDHKEVTHLKSDAWLRWSFSKPVFGKRTTTTTSPGESTADVEIAACEEQTTIVKEQDEELQEDEEEYEEEYDEEEAEGGSESRVEETANDAEIETPIQTPSSSSDTSMSKSGVSIVAAGTIAAAAVSAVAPEPTKPVTEEATKPVTTTTPKASSSDVTKTAADATVVQVEKVTEIARPSSPSRVSSPPGSRSGSPSRPGSPSRKPKRNSSDRTNRNTFKLDENYVPTGFEKIVRYKNHVGNFPEGGYFFIKSSLHGYVLELVGTAVDGADIVLTRMKSTDYAGQLWSYKDGYLVNLKGGHGLVLDASKEDSIAAGERLHLSKKNEDVNDNDDQLWEFNHESMIPLLNKRNIVLSVKELKRSDKYVQIDVYCQEAKPLVKKEARPEQRWEVLIPSLIPITQGESGVKIVESGKIDAVTSSAAAVVSYKWLKETFCHRVTAQNQWPSTEGWFFIRFGTKNHFLASGETAQSEVGLYEVSEKVDYRRFLWTYVDGYLINYRYMLRLILSTSRRWVLSNAHTTLNQKFYISPNGSLSIRIHKTIYYIRFIVVSGSYKLDVTTDNSIKESQGLELHVPVVSDANYQKDLVLAYSSAYAWIRKQKTDWSILNASTSIRRAIFPVATWFFVKVSGAEELVLSVTSDESKSPLALKKLDFKNFKSQLWTFNEGHLINYGSKFVIDVEGSVATSSKIIHGAEAGVSTQKWILTTEGHIELEAHDRFVLGTKEIKDSSFIVLGSSKTPSDVKPIQWKFSTPVFGKKTVTTTTTTGAQPTQQPAAPVDIAKAIEEGAVIESAEEVATVNKSNLALTRRSTKTSVDTYRETLVIIRWWRIVLIRRLANSRTQKEYMQVLEEYRQLLHSRFIQYLTIYRTSVSGEALRAIEDFVAETEDTIEKEIFTKSITYLKDLKEDDVVPTKEFDVSVIVSEACGKIEKKLDTIVESKEKPVEKKDETTYEVIEDHSETETVDKAVIAIDTVHIIIRRWIIIIRRRVVEASKQGAKPEEIEKLIKDSRKELDTEITQVQTTAQTTLSKSPYVSAGYKKQLEQSVSDVIDTSKTELDRFVSNIDVQQITAYTENDWNKVTGEIEDKLVTKVQESKCSIEEYETTTEVEEQPVTVDEKEVESTKLDVVATVAETKAYLVSWFDNFTKDVTWSVQESPKEDTLTVIDAAKLEAVSKIEETIALLSMLSGSLTYLTWTERRRLVTYLITVKTYLLTNVDYFKSEVANSDKEAILKICDSTFGKDQQKDVLKNIDVVVEKVTGKPVTEVISEETYVSNIEVVHQGSQPTVTDVTDSKIMKVIETSSETASSKVTDEEHTKAPTKADKVESVLEDIAAGAAVSVVAGVAVGVASGVTESGHKPTHADVVTDEVEVITKKTSADQSTETVVDTADTITSDVEVVTGETEHVDTAVTAGKITGLVTGEKKPDAVQVDVIGTETVKADEIETTKVSSGEVIVDNTKAGSDVVTAGTIAGAVTETIISDKKTASEIEEVAKKSDSVTVEVAAGEKKSDIVVDTTDIKKDAIVTTDQETAIEVVDTEKQKAPKTDVKPETVIASVIAGAVTENIITDKETATVVDTIVKKSESVDVDVIVGEQEVDTITKDKTTSDSHIDVIVKETKQVVDDKKTVVDDKKTVVDVSETEVIGEEVTVIDTTEVTGVISGTVTETIVKDKDTVSAIDTIVKDSDYITVEVIAGDKKTKAII